MAGADHFGTMVYRQNCVNSGSRSQIDCTRVGESQGPVLTTRQSETIAPTTAIQKMRVAYCLWSWRMCMSSPLLLISQRRQQQGSRSPAAVVWLGGRTGYRRPAQISGSVRNHDRTTPDWRAVEILSRSRARAALRHSDAALQALACRCADHAEARRRRQAVEGGHSFFAQLDSTGPGRPPRTARATISFLLAPDPSRRGQADLAAARPPSHRPYRRYRSHRHKFLHRR
jgi:hypothetical protein